MRATKEDFLAQSEERGVLKVVRPIDASRHHALQAVDPIHIDLYWNVGQIISKRIESAGWGAYIARTEPSFRGFTRPNLFRVKRFHEAYLGLPIVSPLVRQLPWSRKVNEWSLIPWSSESSEEEGL